MTNIQYRNNKTLLIHFDVRFFARFILLFLFFYYVNFIYVGLTTPGGDVYSPFLSNHLNYVSWVLTSILKTSNAAIHLMGFNSYIGPSNTLYVGSTPMLYMAVGCAGLGIFGFWLAFILSQKNTLQAKILWSVGGILCIWLINCIRVTLLFVALNNKWQVDHFIDHHDFFNFCCYAVIIGMMFLYGSTGKKEPTQS